MRLKSFVVLASFLVLPSCGGGGPGRPGAEPFQRNEMSMPNYSGNIARVGREIGRVFRRR
ncbi:MAG: hypothetical protein LBG89_03485 [Rickettsiales bacterium]|nr:hypothetical protein [Rickettsiales bacterium]